jgi:hypothetical protein
MRGHYTYAPISLMTSSCRGCPITDITLNLAGQQITAKPELTDDARHVLDALTH